MKIDNRKIAVAAVVCILAIFAMLMRCLPVLYTGSNDIIDLVSMDDPMYKFRQIEAVIHNAGAYPWYDPMTLMPTGMYPHWGPLFVYITAFVCMVTGSTTIPTMISTSLFIPPIMSAIMVPITYLLVKKAFDWKTALISAVFISTITGQYFARGMFGYLDHHIGEVLFGVIFCLCYVSSIVNLSTSKIDWKTRETLKKPILYGVAAGSSFFAGFLIMPTMILFGLIVAIYTAVMFGLSIKYDINTKAILIINSITFGLPIIGFFMMGYPIVSWIELNHYTLAHPLAWGLAIVGTMILYVASAKKSEIIETLQTVKTTNLKYIVIGLFAVIGSAVVIFRHKLQMVYHESIFQDATQFFGQSSVTNTVLEAIPWDVTSAWDAFGFFIVLSFLGGVILAYKIIKERKGEHIFILIWTVVMLVSAIQHIRYEYFIAVNFAILSSIVVGSLANKTDFSFIKLKLGKSITKISTLEPEKTPLTSSISTPKNIPTPKTKKPPKKDRCTSKTKETKKHPTDNYIVFGGLCLILILSGIAIANGITAGVSLGHLGEIRLNPDWKESLVWLGENTPDTGVDYYKVYDGSNFEYPDTAYGVMSWWDYGHMITFISHRIPNANPFQAGVYGNYSSSSFFMAMDEEKANEILDNLKTKYIITDTNMATGKFWAMATWYDPDKGSEPYIKSLVIRNPNGGTQWVQAYTLDFFSTMITRLHILDGNSYNIQEGIYIEYDPQTKVVYSAEQLGLRDAMLKAQHLQSLTTNTKLETIISPNPLEPIGKHNALRHYRLIHESPSSTISGNGVDIKYVKIFEYVNGYEYNPQIDGILFAETTVTTNTGRKFTYRQEIEGSTFVLPYSGEYVIKDMDNHIVSTISVSEEDVVSKPIPPTPDPDAVCAECQEDNPTSYESIAGLNESL